MRPELEHKIREMAGRYPVARGALVPILRLVQEEERSITIESLETVARILGIPVAEVIGAVSFYALLRVPKFGRYVIQVCHTLSCELAGSEDVVQALRETLGIRHGETTPDGKFTLIEAECLGVCEMGPVMLINEDYYPELTPDKVKEILGSLR